MSELENQVASATRDWQTTIMEAARSLFWILAAIEISVAAIWLALAAATLESWFSELVRRILFVGFFAFLLEQGSRFAKAVVDSLFSIGAGQGSARQRRSGAALQSRGRPCFIVILIYQ